MSILNPGPTRRRGGGAPPGYDAVQHNTDFNEDKRQIDQTAMHAAHAKGFCYEFRDRPGIRGPDMTDSPLAALRQELARRDLDGFIVPRSDEHLGEYVPASAERLAWLTGFTGSAGLAVVLPRSRRRSPTAATCCNWRSRPIRRCGSDCMSRSSHRRPGCPLMCRKPLASAMIPCWSAPRASPAMSRQG